MRGVERLKGEEGGVVCSAWVRRVVCSAWVRREGGAEGRTVVAHSRTNIAWFVFIPRLYCLNLFRVCTV